jgi:DnaJ-class molecular chaperone
LSDPAERGRYDCGEIDGNGTRQWPFKGRPQSTNIHPRGAGFEPFHSAKKTSAHKTGTAVFQQFFRARKPAAKADFNPAHGDHNHELTVSFFEAARGINRRLLLRNGKTIDLAIPPGTCSGRSQRLRRQGEPAFAGGRAGDAIVVVQVLPHEFLTKCGIDVHIDLAVSQDDAKRGGRIRVPTLDGAVTMTLPKGSRPGTTLRLKGKGIEASRGHGRGDQFVSIKIAEATANVDLNDAIAS